MTEHDAQDAQTPTLEDRANKVVNDFLDETANYKPYWPNILVKLVFTALREAADAARAEDLRIIEGYEQAAATQFGDDHPKAVAARAIAAAIRARSEEDESDA